MSSRDVQLGPRVMLSAHFTFTAFHRETDGRLRLKLSGLDRSYYGTLAIPWRWAGEVASTN